MMQTLEEFLKKIGDAFTFQIRPTPVPADLRPDWQIALLVLILDTCCRSGKSSLRRLHVLNWAARSPANQLLLLKRLTQLSNPDEIIVRYEPALNRAIDIAAARGLVGWAEGKRLDLWQAGKTLADAINGAPDVLVQERQFLKAVGMKLTETRMGEIVKGEV